MFKIVEKKSLNPTVSKITVEAPLIAKKAEPGQFIIFRAKEDSERIPLTIADFDRGRNGHHYLSNCWCRYNGIRHLKRR